MPWYFHDLIYAKTPVHASFTSTPSVGSDGIHLFRRHVIESERINKLDILPVRLIQITTTDLDNLAARVDHLISFRVTTLLSQELLAVSILAGEVEANDQTHNRRDDPKRCHE